MSMLFYVMNLYTSYDEIWLSSRSSHMTGSLYKQAGKVISIYTIFIPLVLKIYFMCTETTHMLTSLRKDYSHYILTVAQQFS